MSSPSSQIPKTAEASYGVKEATVCVDNNMKKLSMTTEQLQRLVFRPVVVVSPLPATPVPAPSGTVVTDASSYTTKVLKRKESRQGRSCQRWEDDHSTRLVTGCVPLLRDGRVLLVSSRRKPAWILPKGGWEHDELMEESAVRETFEEAGCVGTLGIALSPVKYETRKSKQQRASLGSNYSFSSEDDHKQKKQKLETAAVVAAPDTPPPEYSHVQMTLFCLYVSEIKDEWPEPGRLRRALTLDEAIDIVRPEFQTVLREVKQRGLHQPPDGQRDEANKVEAIAET